MPHFGANPNSRRSDHGPDEHDPQRTLVDVDVFICATGPQVSITANVEKIDSTPLADIVDAVSTIAEARDIGTVYVADLSAEA